MEYSIRTSARVENQEKQYLSHFFIYGWNEKTTFYTWFSVFIHAWLLLDEILRKACFNSGSRHSSFSCLMFDLSKYIAHKWSSMLWVFVPWVSKSLDCKPSTICNSVCLKDKWCGPLFIIVLSKRFLSKHSHFWALLLDSISWAEWQTFRLL